MFLIVLFSYGCGVCSFFIDNNIISCANYGICLTNSVLALLGKCKSVKLFYNRCKKLLQHVSSVYPKKTTCTFFLFDAGYPSCNSIIVLLNRYSVFKVSIGFSLAALKLAAVTIIDVITITVRMPTTNGHKLIP